MLSTSADPEQASDRVTVIRDEPIRGLDRTMQSRKAADEGERDEDRDDARDPKARVAPAVPPALNVADVECPDQLAPAGIAG